MNRRGFFRSLLVAATLMVAPAMPVALPQVVAKPFVRRRGWGTGLETQDQDYYIEVADDPQLVFEIQEGGTGASLTAAAVNLNANFLAASNNGWMSQYVLDNSIVGTSTTFNLKILGLSQKPNNIYGPYAKWLVLIMNHELV